MRRTVCLMSLVVALLGAVAPARADAALPPVKHIFTIVLENQDFAETFLEGQALAAYTTRTLPLMGALVPGYWGTGHSSLDNYIAMVSGQGPNVDTQGDCNDPSTMGDAEHPSFSMDARGQAIGKGCMYPPPVKSIADQLDGNGLTWKGYMEDMAGPCKTPGDGSNNGDYKTKHNPFVYFHSTTDRKPYCDARDVPLNQLTEDLKSEATTPNFAFIVPNQCNDGHDDQPFCSDGSLGGLVPVDAWMQQWVRPILNSPAFRDDGLLIVLWDEADTDASSCCNEPKGANLGPNETNGQYSPIDVPPLTNGGGQTGAVFISRWITPGTVSTEQYNHYSYLRSVEDLFGIDSGGTDGKGHLGYAAQDGLKSFGSDIFTAFDGTTPPPQPSTEVLGASSSSPPQPAPATGAVGNCVDVPLRIGIRGPRGERVVRVSASVDGKVITRRRGHRIDHVVIPRPQGNVAIVVTASTNRGTRIRSVRSFRGCRLGAARTTTRRGRR
jgi:phosphatidylinositol-3-phosphatase